MNRKLKLEDIKKIPGWIKQDKTYAWIAKELGVSKRTIEYWIKRLRYAGVELKVKHGPRPIKLDD